MSNIQLQLRYDFTSDPYPIRASLAGSNPNTINLQVMISNPSTDPVSLGTITILIPMGEDTQRVLSTAQNLPTINNSPSGWNISTAGGTITINPPKGQVNSVCLFTLENIQVNHTQGVVPVTITEVAPKVTDGTTYELVKQTADFPITKFYASPATLYDLDQTVTLHWECSSQGQQYVYTVHSDSWQPQDCLDKGVCYQCSDGSTGVETPSLTQTTTFALDVIQTNSDGSRSIHETLYTTVPVIMPTISGNSTLTPYLSGRLLRLNWLTINATRCIITMDGNDDDPLDDNAPLDTYLQDYWLPMFDLPEGQHYITLDASAMPGSKLCKKDFNFNIGSAVSVAVGPTPWNIAITPDSKLALVTNSFADNVTVIDIIHQQTESISVGTNPCGIAITPDGLLALVTVGSNLIVIDIAQRQTESSPIPVGLSPTCIAITPDDKFAIVPDSQDKNAYIVDIVRRQVVNKIPVGSNPSNIAITSDGSFALVVNYDDNTVTMIDLTQWQVVAAAIPTGAYPWGIAVTPNNLFALVVNYGNTLTVIDINKQQAESSTIMIGDDSRNIAITPDGKIALVTNGSQSLTVVNIAERKAEQGSPQFTADPRCIAITPDGKHALISYDTGTVTII